MLIILILGLLVPSSTLDSLSGLLSDKNKVVSNTTSNIASANSTNTPAPTNTTNANTVTPATPKCSGNSPCYGPSTMAAHSSSSDCWSYQTSGGVSIIYNMTAFNDVHSDGPKAEILAGCGKAIDWSSVPSNSKHSAAQSNSQRIFLQFKVGYYDSSA